MRKGILEDWKGVRVASSKPPSGEWGRGRSERRETFSAFETAWAVAWDSWIPSLMPLLFSLLHFSHLHHSPTQTVESRAQRKRFSAPFIVAARGVLAFPFLICTFGVAFDGSNRISAHSVCMTKAYILRTCTDTSRDNIFPYILHLCVGQRNGSSEEAPRRYSVNATPGIPREKDSCTNGAVASPAGMPKSVPTAFICQMQFYVVLPSVPIYECLQCAKHYYSCSHFLLDISHYGEWK